MELNNFNIKAQKYTHLKESERYKIEVLLQEKKSVKEISNILGRGRSTIYREIKRGSILRIQSNLTERKQYRANFAQNDYKSKGKNKERSLKIGNDNFLEEYIRNKILKEKYSPDAVIGEIKDKGLKFKGMICTKTLYNYIDKKIFSGISNENLWEKRKRKKRHYKKLTRSRISRNNRMAKSIEQRSEAINNRLEYGHWEGDCVKGPLGQTTSLLTLTERKTLEEIIIKIERTSQEEVKNAIDRLEKQYGNLFKLKFKSITFDNGVEFLDWKSLELSILNPKKQRTTIYFAHAYSAWERGSNEVQNKMIRRFIPKGTNIHDFTEKEINEIQNWMNNYPRKKLGYKSANQLANEYSQINNN